jgi:hypothetical protein
MRLTTKESRKFKRRRMRSSNLLGIALAWLSAPSTAAYFKVKFLEFHGIKLVVKQTTLRLRWAVCTE